MTSGYQMTKKRPDVPTHDNITQCSIEHLGCTLAVSETTSAVSQCSIEVSLNEVKNYGKRTALCCFNALALGHMDSNSPAPKYPGASRHQWPSQTE